MAHLIDNTTGIDAIAFIGDAPWHGLGQRLTAGADIETWRKESGLNYDVVRSAVQYESIDFATLGAGGTIIPSTMKSFSERHVLYRSDTGAPLSVVSKDI